MNPILIKQNVTFTKNNINTVMIKNTFELNIIVVIQRSIEVLHIAYVIYKIVHLKKFFHNSSNYGYYFIIKELAKKS